VKGGRGRGQNAYRMNLSNPRDQDCRSLITRRAYTCLLVHLLHGENQRTRTHTLRKSANHDEVILSSNIRSQTL